MLYFSTRHRVEPVTGGTRYFYAQFKNNYFFSLTKLSFRNGEKGGGWLNITIVADRYLGKID